jgi:hypothetical protein
MKKAVSITLDQANVLWLKGQAAATPGGTVSAVIDRILTDARLAGRSAAPHRSIVNSIDLPGDDPDLSRADAYIGSLVTASLRRPLLVKETRAPYKARGRRRG